MSLSDRERMILRLKAEGMTSAEVAEQLGLSPKTVKAHLVGTSTARSTPAIRPTPWSWRWTPGGSCTSHSSSNF